MTRKKYSNIISIVVGIIVLVSVSIGSYALGIYHGSKKNTSNNLYQSAPESTSPSPVVFNTCKDENLGISIKVPKGWTCNSKKLSDTDSSILLTSNFFNIIISNASRNEFCVSNLSVYGYDPNCVVTKFYSTPAISTVIYTYQGKNKEIYGNVLNANNKPGTPVPWILIQYQNMENQTFSENQKNELIGILDSISPL